MIKIVDYGLGNISAFVNVYKRLNVESGVARSAADLEGASKLILPGVGAFDHAMDLLNDSGMRATLDDMVLNQNVPVLGICVGMQILAEASDEGVKPGLGWVPGKVEGFKALNLDNLMLPHMGWNDVAPVAHSPLFASMEEAPRFYFLHSFYFKCQREQDVAATSHYGLDFSCAVRNGHIHACNFIPRKVTTSARSC
jgi:imidazole glycerol-phosphate synthase subunit HisH